MYPYSIVVNVYLVLCVLDDILYELSIIIDDIFSSFFHPSDVNSNPDNFNEKIPCWWLSFGCDMKCSSRVGILYYYWNISKGCNKGKSKKSKVNNNFIKFKAKYFYKAFLVNFYRIKQGNRLRDHCLNMVPCYFGLNYVKSLIYQRVWLLLSFPGKKT